MKSVKEVHNFIMFSFLYTLVEMTANQRILQCISYGQNCAVKLSILLFYSIMY